MTADSQKNVASFGYWVRRRRKALDLTQSELAQRVGCTSVMIKKIERDERRPSRQLTELLADRLVVPQIERDTFMRLARGELVNPPFTLASPLEGPVFKPNLPVQSSPFVARERELAQLERFLQLALVGQGRVIFVMGEAGFGKTRLVEEFAHRAQEEYPDLIVAGGQSNAYGGIGDPYLPFREILALLTGDIAARRAAGTISQEHSRRLSALLPEAVEVLVNLGPDLVDIFISGSALAKRAAAAIPGRTDWLTPLQELVNHTAVHPAPAHLSQSTLLTQYVSVLLALAAHKPLLLILDDLQWADAGSISLLFHLSRRLEGQRVLVVGIYRPSDVALGRSAGGAEPIEGHPLAAVIGELQHQFGQIHIDLGQAEGRHFVESFLETEPNRLDTAFRDALYRQTGGHALFTVEMLRGLQDRGDLVQDEQGRWVVSSTLDWKTLPARVEGVISERISRLPTIFQEALKVASVEGELFTAEVMARVQGVDEQHMVRQLSSELGKKHRLVRVQSSQRLNGQPLSQYRFEHILFQKYLYQSLDETERVYLHEAVGQTLEQLYGEQAETIAIQLARHFQAAGLVVKAVGYLQQAGEQAARLSIHKEAVALFTKALKLLYTLPDPSAHSQQELNLQIALGYALIVFKGSGTPEVERAFVRAQELSYQLEETHQLFHLLWGLWTFWLVRGTIHSTAHELAEQYLRMAQRLQNPTLLLGAYVALGITSLLGGNPVLAQAHLEQAMVYYNPQQSAALISLYGQDLGVYCLRYLSWAKWLLGYPEQALIQSDESLTLARQFAHPFSLAGALAFDIFIHYLRREEQAVKERAEECFSLSTKHGFALWKLKSTMFGGWALTQQGQLEEGVKQIRQGLADYHATGARLLVLLPLLLIESYLRMGQVTEGLAELEKTFSVLEKTGESTSEAELYRLKGELLRVRCANEGEVETCFCQAIKIAQRQGAKSLELRAVMSLSHLWQGQGRREEARQMLAETYGWFSEGFDTPDLQEAKILLETLGE